MERQLDEIEKETIGQAIVEGKAKRLGRTEYEKDTFFVVYEVSGKFYLVLNDINATHEISSDRVDSYLEVV